MICINVSLALQLQDDFSGAPLHLQAPQFWVDGNHVVPIKKPEGFFVFTQSLCAQSVLSVAVQGYCPLDVPAQHLQHGTAQGVLQLRLLRSNFGARHAAKGDSHCIVGTAPPAQRVIATSRALPPLHLQGMGEKDGVGWVLLQGHHAASAIHHRYCVCDGGAVQYFVVVGRNRDGTFALQEPLRDTFAKGAQVQRVYTALSDAQGNYQLFVDTGQSAEDLQLIYAEKEAFDWQYKYVTAPS